MIGVAAVVVIAAVVTVIVLSTRGSGTAGGTGTLTPSPTSGLQSSPVSVAGSTAAPAVPTVPQSCDASPIDSSGMTPCLAALAGPNADRAIACVPASADTAVASAIGGGTLVAVSGCDGLDKGGLAVAYVQVATADQAQAAIDALSTSYSVQKKDWHSGNGNGWYVAAVTERGPELYWSYDGLPALGYVTVSSDATAGSEPTAEQIGTFWQQQLLPQTTS